MKEQGQRNWKEYDNPQHYSLSVLIKIDTHKALPRWAFECTCGVKRFSEKTTRWTAGKRWRENENNAYLNRKHDYSGQLAKFLVSLLETTIYKGMKTSLKE